MTVGRSATIRRVADRLEELAATDAAVLIRGEPGAGRIEVARRLHRRGRRRDRPLQIVDASVLPAGLVEAALFGYERGAFIGASTRRPGWIEAASGSSLYLAAADRLAPGVQLRLLRWLDSGRIARLGSEATRPADVRLIVGVGPQAMRQAADGGSRHAFEDRLRDSVVELPPIRQRPEDIPLLVWFCVRRLAARWDKPIRVVPEATMRALVEYPWPGDLRELEHVLARSVTVSPAQTLIVDPAWLRSPSAADPAVEARSERLETVEARHIEAVLDRTAGRIKGPGGAAQRLGLHPSTLYSRMKKLGISRSR